MSVQFDLLLYRRVHADTLAEPLTHSNASSDRYADSYASDCCSDATGLNAKPNTVPITDTDGNTAREYATADHARSNTGANIGSNRSSDGC